MFCPRAASILEPHILVCGGFTRLKWNVCMDAESIVVLLLYKYVELFGISHAQ